MTGPIEPRTLPPYPPQPVWVLTCYDKEVGEYPDLQEAMPAADAHILTCPQGAMPWATVVKWHPTAQGWWVSAANGDWLNHHLRPKPVRMQTEPGDPGPVPAGNGRVEGGAGPRADVSWRGPAIGGAGYPSAPASPPDQPFQNRLSCLLCATLRHVRGRLGETYARPVRGARRR